MNPFLSSPKVKLEIGTLYHQKLDDLAIRYEFMKIETTYGDTNIIITGAEEKAPLVLLHGFNGCAPVAIEAMIDLTTRFRIYAVDMPGHSNLSAELRLNMKDDTCGKWMHEILSRLGVKNAFLVGISMGGFVAWKTLVFDESRIKRAFLIVPAGIVNGNPLKIFRKVFLPIKRYKKKKESKYVRRLLSRLFSEEDDFALSFLSKVLLHFKMDFSSVPLITKKETQAIKTPVHFIGAENDLLFPGEKMLKRVQRIFPSLAGRMLLENSKHIPGRNDSKKVAALISSHL